MLLAAFRLGAVQGLTGVSLIALARLLEPREYGLYVSVWAVAAVLYHLTQAGFNAVFVREQERPIGAVVRAAATLLLLVALLGCAASAALIASGAVRGELAWLLAGACVWLLACPLRFQAEVEFHRELAFGRLAALEAVEVIALQGGAILGASLGYGAAGTAIGMALAGPVVAVTASILARVTLRPARLGLLGSWLREVMPFELSALVVLARERASVPALAVCTSAAAAGLFSWAYSLALVAVVFANLVGHVLYAAFARITDPAARARGVTLATRMLALAVVPLIATVAACAEPLVRVVYDPRWLPALPTLWVLCTAAALTVLASPLLHLAFLDGRIEATNRWLAAQVGVIWLGGLPLAVAYGPVGLAGAWAAAAALGLWLCYRSGNARYRLRLAGDIFAVLASGFIAGLAGYVAVTLMDATALSLLVGAAVTFATFALVTSFLRGRELIRDLKDARVLARA